MKKLKEQEIRNVVAECWAKLKKEKLNEATISVGDMIKKGLEIGAAIETASIPGEDAKTFNELISDDKFEIDISEKDLEPNGIVSESFKKSKLKKLSEGIGFTKALKEYIAEGGQPDMEAFGIWAENHGYENVLDSISKSGFNANFRKFSGQAVSGKTAKNSEEPLNAPADPSTYSEDLNAMLEICNSGAEYVESAAETVEFKYKQIRSRLRRVIQGRSANRYYLLMGDPGIGKSFIVRETLDMCGKQDVPQITGTVGKSPAPVAKFLIEHKDDEIVILDDCDTMISNEAKGDVTNMLKGALDPDRHHVSISPTLINIIKGYMKEQAIREKYKGNYLFESDQVLEERIARELAESEGEEEEEDIEIPKDFDFNARIIFISNLNADQVSPAVLDRCDKYELHLTVEEYMIRLGKIIWNIECGQKEGIYTDEEVKEAKALLMYWMAGIIEAHNKGASMFGKRVVLVKGGLTFRLVKDLVEAYIINYQDYVEDNPDVPVEEAKTHVVRDWVHHYVLPKITA